MNKEYLVHTRRVAPGEVTMSAIRMSQLNEYKKSVYDLRDEFTTAMWIVRGARNAQQAMAMAAEKGAGFKVDTTLLWARSKNFRDGKVS